MYLNKHLTELNEGLLIVLHLLKTTIESYTDLTF